MSETASGKRGTALTIFAVLFGLLAISNLLKPFQVAGPETGFVLLGIRLTGTANAIAGPLFGIFLAAYALSIWQMRRAALPMAYLYAGYVIVNLVLFGIWGPPPPEGQTGAGRVIFVVVYAIIAIGCSSGAAVLLKRRQQELR